MMITGTQLRMLRAATDESLQVFAEGAGVSHVTLSQIEKDSASPTTRTLEKILRYAEKKGYALTADGGIAPKKEYVERYEGTEGFRKFMDDVYEVAKEQGGEICLFNARPSNWTKWLGAEWYEAHTARMANIMNNFVCKITCEEGNYNFIGSKHAEYRWVPKEIWNEQSFYSYGDRIGFLNFEDETVDILVLKQKEFAESFRVLFDIAWDQISIIPDADNYKPAVAQ